MTSLLETMAIQELEITSDHINSTIRTQFISQYGHPDNQEWLFEGALANVIASEMENGPYHLVSWELKNGLTSDDFRAHLEEKHDDQANSRGRLKQHLANYPTGLVSPEFRRYHPNFIHEAAGTITTMKDQKSGDQIIKGEYAQATCTTTQEIGRSHRIKDLRGKNKHMTYEFWHRLSHAQHPSLLPEPPTPATVHSADELRPDLEFTERDIAGAIQIEYQSQYGHSFNKETLLEGRLANVRIYRGSRGNCWVNAYELKNGCTQDELRSRLGEAKQANEEALNPLEAQHHLTQYPTNMVVLEHRRYTEDLLDRAAGLWPGRYKELPQDLLDGEYAWLTLKPTGRALQESRVEHLIGRNHHDTHEFWQNIREILDQNR